MHRFEYFLVPAFILALFFPGAHPYTFLGAALCIALGVFLWTLVEYWMHRALHLPRFMPFHLQHHQHPGEDISGQEWSGLPLGAFFVLGLWAPTLAPLIQGLMMGYFWFLTVHWAMHHGYLHDGDLYLGPLLVKHEIHHQPREERWFGVTTSVWDHVFGTAN